jgi:large subunit ribosomal protein L17
MRHGKKGFKLGRTHAHRKATLAALSTALIKHKRIRTTITKAKALRMYVEPLITRCKEDTTHNRRQVFRHLQDKYAVTELFGEISDKIGDRNGGYTRIVKLGQRSDGAEMAIIEFVDFNDSEPSSGGKTRRSGRTRRGGGGGRRRGGAKQATQAAATTTAVETETQVLAPDDEMEGVQTETVETPVADEVATPVEERTEDTPEGVEAEVVEADADEPEAPEEPAAEAEVETAPEETEAVADEPEAEAAEQPESEADQADDAEEATDDEKKDDA